MLACRCSVNHRGADYSAVGRRRALHQDDTGTRRTNTSSSLEPPRRVCQSDGRRSADDTGPDGPGGDVPAGGERRGGELGSERPVLHGCLLSGDGSQSSRPDSVRRQQQRRRSTDRISRLMMMLSQPGLSAQRAGLFGLPDGTTVLTLLTPTVVIFIQQLQYKASCARPG